jgi:X-linked retinitis pigmentosa GTPase regulator
VVRVVCGDLFSAALTAEGRVFAWGNGIQKQQSNQPTELAFTRDTTIVTIAAANTQLLALDQEGRVWAVGQGLKGELGLGSARRDIEAYEPRMMTALQGENVVGVFAGRHVSAFVTETGALFTCGSGRDGKLGYTHAHKYTHTNTPTHTHIHTYTHI